MGARLAAGQLERLHCRGDLVLGETKLGTELVVGGPGGVSAAEPATIDAGRVERRTEHTETADGLLTTWAVNVLAPYVLTALLQRPDRLVYLSSGMHLGGDPSLQDVQWTRRRWNGAGAYSDSKLHDVLLALAVARLRGRPDPGFVDVAKLLPIAYGVASVLLVMGVVLIVGDLVVPLHVPA